MKSLNKIAQDLTDRSNDLFHREIRWLYDEDSIVFIKEAYHAGFIFALGKAAQLADDWNPDDTNGALGEAIMNIGESDT